MGFMKGSFVKVGDDVGVVVFAEGDTDIPAEHIGVWYGELSGENLPKYRTVPSEYCEIIKSVESYH